MYLLLLRCAIVGGFRVLSLRNKPGSLFLNPRTLSMSLLNCACVCVCEGGGGAMVLGKPPYPGRLTNLDYSMARAYCVYSRCRWGLFGHFFLSSINSLFFPPLSGRRRLDID